MSNWSECKTNKQKYNEDNIKIYKLKRAIVIKNFSNITMEIIK